MLGRISIATVALVFSGIFFSARAELVVRPQEVQELKAVFATVTSVDVAMARARLSGTVSKLTVDEGSAVEAGQRIAVIVDKKLPIQISALDARLKSLAAQLELARIDYGRTVKLRKKGTVSQSRLDEARTNLDVLKSSIAALRAERAVVVEQRKEGDVLAPTSGRVLKVPVTEGAVVQPGELIAQIATEKYVLRLELPERHARFIRKGDKVLVGQRGLETRPSGLRNGIVKQVYPEIVAGRVEADVTVAGLGDYFVGERTRVWVSAGSRMALVVPPEYIFRRFGISYAKLKDGTEVVVQPGQVLRSGLEILSGLRDGDVLVKP